MRTDPPQCTDVPPSEGVVWGSLSGSSHFGYTMEIWFVVVPKALEIAFQSSDKVDAGVSVAGTVPRELTPLSFFPCSVFPCHILRTDKNLFWFWSL